MSRPPAPSHTQCSKIRAKSRWNTRGTYEYSYLAQATSSGEFQAMPATGYEMYFPDVWGRSYAGKLSVEP
jgi:uncharacterized protein YfaS (alpha-2-macroglobulin family)